MKHIVIDVRMIRHSGIGTYIRNVVPRLLPLFPKDRFSFVGTHESVQELVPANERVRVRTIESQANIYSIREQLELWRKVPEFDVFWSPHYNFPVLMRGKKLATVHDVFHLAMPEYVGGYLKKQYANVMFRQLVKRADRLITVSDFTKQELLRYTNGGQAKTTAIHNGVDRSWFIPTDMPSPHSKDYLLYVGNVKPHKNLQRLLIAFETLSKNRDLDLIIVGKKDGFITGDEFVAKKAEEMGDRVVFTGYVTDESLKQYYSHARMLAFPSLYEGFCLPPLEAMACGCPVVVSNAASLPEVCGDAALYCDPLRPESISAEIERLLNDDVLRASKIERGFELAKSYTWERCAASTAHARRARCTITSARRWPRCASRRMCRQVTSVGP